MRLNDEKSAYFEELAGLIYTIERNRHGLPFYVIVQINRGLNLIVKMASSNVDTGELQIMFMRIKQRYLWGQFQFPSDLMEMIHDEIFRLIGKTASHARLGAQMDTKQTYLCDS